MGAKTWMLMYSSDNIPNTLKNNATIDKEATYTLLKKLFPNETLTPIENGDLSYTNPPKNIIYAGCFDGVSIIAADEFAGDYPSKLEPRFIDSSLGKSMHLHAMHSAVDWFAFAKWENGHLVRSLSLSPDSDVLEDIGEKLDFEKDYWNGKHPAIDPEEDEIEYPFAFHPLDLGEAALKEFFGYQLEGYVDDSLIEPEEIPLLGFKRVKPKPWWKIW